MNDTFAIRLLRAQAAAGMTQAKLAKAIGLHHTSLCDYQEGKSQPKLSTLVRIAQALNVSTDYLCCLKESP